MDGVSGEAAQRQRGLWERLLPLRVAETVVTAVAEIGMFADQGLRIGASVGIACSGGLAGRERIADELMVRADRAMYEAKRAGKGRYRFAEEDK